MTNNVVILLEDDPVSMVFRIFDRARISGAPVVCSTGEYSGVMTKTDLTNLKLLDECMKYRNFDTMPVRAFMNAGHMFCVPESGTLGDVVGLLAEHRIHRVFVKNTEGLVVGVVSALDIVKVLAERCGKSVGGDDNKVVVLKFLDNLGGMLNRR